MQNGYRPLAWGPLALVVLLGSSLWLTALAADGNIAPRPGSSRPNIVLVMADDVGWGDVAYNGNPTVKTPALDRMAREGIRLDRFYSGAPVCTPTRASCLTGRNCYRTGVIWAGEYPLPDQEITLAEALREGGYTTGFFGKWHLGTLTTDVEDGYHGGPDKPQLYGPPWEHGFDRTFAAEISVPTYNPQVWDYDWFDPPESGHYFIMKRPLEKGEGTIRGPKMVPWASAFWEGPGDRVTADLVGPTPKVVMDPALDWISHVTSANKPFFAVVWFFSAHSPIAAGDRHRQLYPELSIQQQHWFGCLSAMDEQIGRLRDELRELDAAENTLVWFCSDNGPSWVHELNSAGPYRGQKADLYEGGIRVPAIVQWPAGLKGGRVLDAPMSTDDFYPTLLAMAGVKTANQPVLDGIDVTPLLTGDIKRRPRPLFFQAPLRQSSDDWYMGQNRQMAISDNDWKLISRDNGKSFELYDMINDATEKTDLSFTRPEQVASMKAQLQTWIESCRQSAEGADYERSSPASEN